jgi:putative heme iron utilization protein
MDQAGENSARAAPAPGDPGREVRALMRGAVTATLGTLDATTSHGPAPTPYCSLVLSACDQDGSPILLLSRLARHTGNLAQNDSVSLLYDGTYGHDEPLTGPRATVLGSIAPTGESGHRDRFLARHPSAAQYADFADFAFYRVTVHEAHLVAGFGRISTLTGSDIILPSETVQAIATAEQDIVTHMNADHGDAIDAYARGLADHDETGWRMAACDPEGIDLRHGNTLIRITFPAVAATPADMRTTLVALVRTARNASE